ncbi:S-acyl fatty acid synthase thioesterase, medium chain [Monodelphis domestica]|uniref:S-acyl fatty acid synthase thioesterase, medium chain n=1 Tax=Monodelphis domestica TaxID=13616 RepID=UPI0024E1C465|nr:S-acyl fatty acid synthase thioesterase, medium chain [Monodelphis domestica]XP_007504996.2 S-acyl fatty acid synthase thioesterase, medium chain [Monodelphis domestica]XP_007504997.2 S-acyl fatty acid synthase thioesterase, medium chain [Monodelphis domestica]XP_056656139.1 S-acyl fatty acid synthase thioesterase, medium chain [Monodelphis domestica]
MESKESVKEMRTENVVSCLYQQPDTVFKLICFPWAGSGSLHFAKWGKSFHHSIEVSSIRLPGRECRDKEPFATNLDHVIAEVSNALLPLIQDKTFAFFGHSLGSYIAYFTAHHLKQNHGLQPVHIFLSSASPPHKSYHGYFTSTSSMSEEQLHHFILNMGGTPKEILENKELLEMFLPVFKADIQMARNYSFVKPSKPLSCDFTCFSGTEDIVAVEGWKDLTSGSVDNYKLPGDHFYLINPSNESFIINYITKSLEVSHFI